jgi:hypothetical protein
MNFDVERVNLKKLDDLESKEVYEVKVSNRFAAFGSVDNNVDISRAWESVKKKKYSAEDSLGYDELKSHKLPFGNE